MQASTRSGIDAEILVFQFLSLGGRGAEEGAAAWR